MKKPMWIAIVILVTAAAAAGGLYGTKAFLRSSPETSATVTCEEHGIMRCPFCDPSLLQSMGFCKEHGVPEAICTRCRDDLEAVFRRQNDWCTEHRRPESQCELCNPGTLEKYRKYAPAAEESGR